MKRLLLTMVMFPLLLAAQPEFYGYFESEADGMRLGATGYHFGYHKFRLDLEARPNDHVLIGANMNIQNYWGKTSWNVFDFIPDKHDPGIPFNILLSDTLYLDNMYVKASFSLLDLTLGRQQLSPGVGYAWNPTDIFNNKSLMDPSYEQAGVDAIRMELFLGDRSSFTSTIQPADDFWNSTLQLILSGGLGHFDFGLNLTRQLANDSEPILGDPYIDERFLLGGNLVGELLGWGVWSEIAYNTFTFISIPAWSSSLYHDEREPYQELLVGVDHTFDNSFYLLAELLHNEYGVKQKEDLSVNDFLNSLTGTSHSLMQDYGFLYISHPSFDYVSLSALIIANFNDSSGTLAPQVDWNVFEDTNISLQTSLFWGDDDSEFGFQDWGVRCRLRSDF